MSTEWFFSRKGERTGPISSAELKALAGSERLNPSDLLWKEGMTEWVSARRLKGLFPKSLEIVATAPQPNVVTVEPTESQPDILEPLPTNGHPIAETKPVMKPVIETIEAAQLTEPTVLPEPPASFTETLATPSPEEPSVQAQLVEDRSDPPVVACALETELTEWTTVTLPRAYRDLGSTCTPTASARRSFLISTGI